MVQFHTEYIAAGGNRHSAAADWDSFTGILAYGSHNNVALWRPLTPSHEHRFSCVKDEQHNGIFASLRGHSDLVNVVKFFHSARDWPDLLLSGSADRTIRLWQLRSTNGIVYDTVGVLQDHTGSIGCIDVLPECHIIASGSADTTIKIWQVQYAHHQWNTILVQSIHTSPRYIPLTLALSALSSSDFLLAAAGTRRDVFIYASRAPRRLDHQTTLSGHEAWIRSLTITAEDDHPNADLLLASASQDKYIRLWRIQRDAESATEEDHPTAEGINFDTLLLNRTHKIETATGPHTLTFEALLLGHDDWIHTVSWTRDTGRLRLLSASADNSLAMWDADKVSGLWICTTRLGEISAQKGSTTATGSMGGFWIGLWLNHGQSAISLGRTGSWRLWSYDRIKQRWVQVAGISGHTGSVRDLAWARDGSYLLSTGADQTTRLHAECLSGLQSSWHELARPQIHGYDLNCIDTVGRHQFVSGAHEKLLRAFNEPKRTAELLRRLCGVKNTLEQEMPEAADIPVLGLSNKASEGSPEQQDYRDNPTTDDSSSRTIGSTSMYTQDSNSLPIEDDLARHTLWPESEKLYGHGYEISAVAGSNDGSLVATACKASSLDHAVIRLFRTQDWMEVSPPLKAHTLTITSLRFGHEDHYLLSTGRDRQWAVFERNPTDLAKFALKARNLKAHSRMILNACWVPVVTGDLFVTVGRDKTSKIWDLQRSETAPVNTIVAPAPVTAVDALHRLIGDTVVLAVATEAGNISIYFLKEDASTVQSSYALDQS
ncbi:MAG: hypothetical protein Q9222_001212 [Ikaeria aurantiellina]